MVLWLKAFHIVFVTSWFAGLFYLPRLFVYHAVHPDGPIHRQFCIMERRLYRFIMQPAMVLTVLLGFVMSWMEWSILVDARWYWLKLALVVCLVGYHFHCGKEVKRFATGEACRGQRFYRVYNEVPTLLLIAIVVLVVVRPF